MSVSSATTLISPAATTSTTTTMQRSQSHHGHKARTAGHGHGHHHAHAGKRRPSAHAAHTTGHIGGPGTRRGSESEGGRKAVFAGLTMATVDGHAKEKGKRRKSQAQEERPGPKSSRSDSNLLRRTTSITSNTSSQHGTGTRPSFKEKNSENSVVVVEDDGKEVEAVDAEDGDWDDEDAPGEGEEAENSDDKDLMSQAMRRTMSETGHTIKTQSPEEMSVKPASIHSPVISKSRLDAPSLIQRKTTGFAGKHPEPEPEPNEIVPLRRVQSVKELAAEAIGNERKVTAHKLAVLDREREQAQERQNSGPNRTRSTEGSGLPKNMTAGEKEAIETSPSYPFPRVLDQPPESSAMAQRSTSGSGPGPYPLRHRPSNTSLRSTASYRAPPHPLNHAGGHSRTASTAMSPANSEMRSMHQPPLAPPVINTEAAAGHSWDIPEHQEVSSMRPPPPMNRRESASSQRSLRAIFAPTSSRMAMTSRSVSNGMAPPPSQNGPTPHRRPTAMEAASAASKLHTTNNPALYHQSLGYSTASAETAHLISRFLPPKKSTKPPWIITTEMMHDGQPHIGITEGDYRDAHDSLLRQMRELGSTSSTAMGGGGNRKSGLRIASNFLSVGQGRDNAVGLIKSRNGPLDVAKGGWRGKSPFELSVERCLQQRPRAPGM